ncbi:MAG: DsrE family protein [Aliarcobacter sp.]|nr:DsrE family protein [Aliarcobacter sp.]
MKKIILIVLMTIFSYGQSKFNDPQPTFENPRKLVINLHVDDLDTVNHTIGSIYNILKEYPSDTLKVAVVLYGKGMRAIKKDYDKNTLTRIKSLMEYDVEFVGCRNTMETMKWKDDDFIDGVEFVQAGIVEVIERQMIGYVGVTPY